MAALVKRRAKLDRMAKAPGSILLALLTFCVLLGLSPLSGAAEDHGAAGEEELTFEHVPGATALEGRIIAPCCWNQTIDIHGSPASTALRAEIRRRLKSGETAETIEASLVARYGERIIAVPRGSRLGSTGVLLAIAMGAAGVFAFALLRRWRDRGAEPPKRDGDGVKSDQALDARVDAELAALDRD